jgi:ABC-2 type transport system permease protein
MRTVLHIGRKEFASFFSSPIAYIFLGVFLAANLFLFFWVETFYAANLAEIRPLFKWMPILLIFLTAAVTMRQWAEERRAGTLEFLLTSPLSPVALVLGKFLACLGLVATGLLLTLPLPLTVSLMGPLDWGPVVGGYLASLFLAAAYIAIGLFVSGKSDNQIVSLIVATLLCSLFYLLGSEVLTALVGNRGTEILQQLGTGSRFEAITRGVIDLRDLFYYLTITGVFLTLNVYGLEKIRWAGNPTNSGHRRWQLATALLLANLLLANFWLGAVDFLRLDLTQGRIYSISPATRAQLAQLQEPLLIRGYFSPQTHPLLAPLVPRLRDLIREYQVAGGGRVRVEFVDPLEHPELEQEAGQKYGIRPVPFQTASKYQAAVTNSYFHLLVQYGDQFETLGFRELIEVKAGSETELEVELRNPEYDITRAIKKVLASYQGGGDLFATIGRPVEFVGYLSPVAELPEELAQLRADLEELLAGLAARSSGLFTSRIVDPTAEGGALAEKISAEFGFRPLVVGLFAERSFWFSLTLASNGQVVEIPLPEDLSREGLERDLIAGLKRFAAGVTRTVALHTPPATPPMPQFGMPGRGAQFHILREALGQEHNLVSVDLDNGRVAAEADILLLVSPEELSERQLFAVDQFLMQGGTVVVATSAFQVGLERELTITSHRSGLEEWLRSHGLEIGRSMVLDPQNSAFPVPMERQVGGFTVQETRLVNYPYFIDIRPDGMDSESGLLTGLQQLTMNWASPLTVVAEAQEGRRVLPLLHSSSGSWLSSETAIQPDFRRYPQLGFAVGEGQRRHLLGVVVEGRFRSYFADKTSPLLAAAENKEEEEAMAGDTAGQEEEAPEIQISRQIDRSPESARLVVFASNSFLNDTIIGIGSAVLRSSYLGPLQLVSNTLDWSMEDRALLEIRGRGHFSRTLLPMSRERQVFWEYANYLFALAGLVFLWLLRQTGRRALARRFPTLLPVDGGGRK